MLDIFPHSPSFFWKSPSMYLYHDAAPGATYGHGAARESPRQPSFVDVGDAVVHWSARTWSGAGGEDVMGGLA